MRIAPNLPAEIDQALTFRRIIHVAQPAGGYRQVPFTLNIRKEGKGKKQVGTKVTVNGQPAERAEVADLAGMDRVEIEIAYVCGK